MKVGHIVPFCCVCLSGAGWGALEQGRVAHAQCARTPLCVFCTLQMCLLRIRPPVVSHTEFNKLHCGCESPLPFLSCVCHHCKSKHLDSSGRLSMEAAADGQLLSKAFMVACGQNRSSILHGVLHYTHCISKMTTP